MPPRHVVGCMTGTSIDGLDAALLAIENTGLDRTDKIVKCIRKPLTGLDGALRSLADQQPMTARQIATLARHFGQVHAEAVAEVAGSQKLDLIAVHGQTVFHDPPVSWQ